MECASCRADLDAIDRYCPACRAPNMQGTLRPRFGPAIPDPAPLFTARVVPPGCRPCPRCQDGIRPRDTYCRSCGLDVSLLAPLPPSDRTVGVWTTPGPHGLDSYRPLRRLTAALRALVVVIALVGVALGVVGLLLWSKLGGGDLPFVTVPDSSLAWSDMHSWAVGLAEAQVGLVLVASLLTVWWTRRAYRNLAPLDVHGKRLAPIWATLGWFVPGANLVIPKVVFDTTWRASEPTTRHDADWRRQPVPTVNHLWWVCTLVALPIMALAFVELSGLGALPPTLRADVHAARATLVLLAVAEMLVVFAAALYLVTLGGIAGRQAGRAERLGPPAALHGLHDAPVEVPVEAVAEPALASAETESDPWTLELTSWPGSEPALAHLGTPDTRAGRY